MNTDEKQGLKNYLYHNRSQIDKFSYKKLEKLYDNKIPDWYDVPKKPTRPPPKPPTTILSQKKQTEKQKKQTSQQQYRKEMQTGQGRRMMDQYDKALKKREEALAIAGNIDDEDTDSESNRSHNLLKQRNILDQIQKGGTRLKKTNQKITSQSKQKKAVRNELKNRRRAISGNIDSSDEDTDSDDNESIFD